MRIVTIIFALVIAFTWKFQVASSATQPWVEIVSPNSGEIWEVGKTYTVVWRYQNVEYITLSVVQDGTKYWDYFVTLKKVILSDQIQEDRISYTVPATLPRAGGYKIKIEGSVLGLTQVISDWSNNEFSVSATSASPVDLYARRIYFKKQYPFPDFVFVAEICNAGLASQQTIVRPVSVSFTINSTDVYDAWFGMGYRIGSGQCWEVPRSKVNYPAGTYVVHVKVDYHSTEADKVNVVAESNEQNNELTEIITIPPISTEPQASTTIPENNQSTLSSPKSDGTNTSLTPENRDSANTPITSDQKTKTDAVLLSRLKGYILLQVEGRGEAWYVDEKSKQRYYLKDGQAAYVALRKFGLGITNIDLTKIPVGFEDRFEDVDSDNDGLADKLEVGLGTDPLKSDSDSDGFSDGVELRSGNNPLGNGMLLKDIKLIDRLKGKILIQVESRGEAWYVNPKNGKRYYLKDGNAAYQIMRFLSLGITNSDISKIKVGSY